MSQKLTDMETSSTPKIVVTVLYKEDDTSFLTAQEALLYYEQDFQNQRGQYESRD
jgi:hypothetical protein